VFDCDSTIVGMEGIDRLAEGSSEVAELTAAAMAGAIQLEDVYGRRLAIVKPSRASVLALAAAYERALVPDARAVIRALHAEGIAVFLVSGGLRPAVERLAQSLGIAPERVAAVDIHFDESGDYADFDGASPLTRSGGKREVLERWTPPLERPIWLVGDGMTDLEAKAASDAFIVFAGVVRHEAVVAQADVVVTSPSLAPVLALALGDLAPEQAEAREVYERGVKLLAGACD
jgi:phosphoserine phosphatase